MALSDSSARSATCRVLDPAYLLRISASSFQELLTEASPAGRAFRRGLIDALSAQLRSANARFVGLRARGGA